MLLSFEVATRPQGAVISTLSPSASAAAIGVLPKGFFVKCQLGRLGSLGKKSPDPPAHLVAFPSRRGPVLLPVLEPDDGDLAATAHAETGWLAISPTASRPIAGCDTHTRVGSAAHLQPNAGVVQRASHLPSALMDGASQTLHALTHYARFYCCVGKRRRELGGVGATSG